MDNLMGLTWTRLAKSLQNDAINTDDIAFVSNSPYSQQNNCIIVQM